MTWVKLDDKMLGHPRIAAVGGLGFAVHVAGIIYCGQHLTDGFVPRGAVSLLLNLDGVALDHGMHGDDASVLAVIESGQPGSMSLEDADLWEWDETRNGWHIRDYLDYNPSRTEVQRGRAADAARKRNKGSNQRKRSGRNPGGVQTESSAPVPEPEPEPEPSRLAVETTPGAAVVERQQQHQQPVRLDVLRALPGGAA